MLKPLTLLLALSLATGCFGIGGDDPVDPTPEPTPEPTPTPTVEPTPTPTPPTNVTPATPTPPTNVTPVTPTPVATKRVNWTVNVTVGGTSAGGIIPGTSTGGEAGCVALPSVAALAGNATATWNGTASTPLIPAGTPPVLQLLFRVDNMTNASASGAPPLSLPLPAFASTNATQLVMQTNATSSATQTQVLLAIWLDIPEAAAEPAAPTATSCPRVASS